MATACKTRDNGLYHFDPRTIKEKEITLSEIADDITYIPLDNGFPISLIYRTRYFIKNSIYISALNSGVMVFDRNGKFIRKIGSIGRGPGEYVSCFNFAVDENTESVYVLNGSLSIIKVYSKNGTFLRDISLKDFGDGADQFVCFSSHLLIPFHLQFGDSRYDWIILDTLGRVVSKKNRTITPFTSNWLIGGGLYEFDNKICQWNPFSDTVFSIQTDLKYQTSFLFSPGDHRLPRSSIDMEKMKTYFNPYQVLETNHFLLFRYLFNSKLSIALIDKNSRNSFSTKLESLPVTIGENIIGGIYNDVDGGVRFQPESYFVENNREYLVGLINALQLKSLKTNKAFEDYIPSYPNKKEKLVKLANSIAETDNQIFMIVRLKK
jgi:hypothetical protein